MQILRNITDADAAAPTLSAVADAALKALLPRVQAEFAEAHGRIGDSGFAVLAFGRLGSGEMSVGSDLDLVFVYDAPDDSPGSDGKRGLSPSVYYTRLSQRMISALTVLTGEGRLYEVDTRLRPQGNSGPMASRLDAWRRYYHENAWTWEHMALTRARVVACTDDALAARITDTIRDILVTERDVATLARNAADMRQRIATQKATDDPWQVKQVAGGLVDLEFLAQYLQLAHAHNHPQVLAPQCRPGLRCRGIIGAGRAGNGGYIDRRAHPATSSARPAAPDRRGAILAPPGAGRPARGDRARRRRRGFRCSRAAPAHDTGPGTQDF